MARPVIKIDRGGVAELLNDPGVRRFLAGIADRVESAAQAGAPVDSGEYRDSIRRVSATTDRAVERVVATAPHAALVEARTGNLARALGSAGV